MPSQFHFTTLANHPELLQHTLKIIEDGFQYPESESYYRDFFLLMGPHNREHCHLLIDDENKVLAHIGVSLRSLGGASVAILGGIAVHELARGKGLFKTLMERVLEIYSPKVCLFLLWSDHFDLYKKFSFYLAGGQITIKATSAPMILPPDYKKSKWKDLEAEVQIGIKDLYHGHALEFYTIERSDEDWKAIEGVTTADFFYKVAEDQTVESYFIMNKGFDLQNVIYEVCGEREQRKELYRKLSGASLWLPESEKEFFRGPSVNYMGLFRLGDKKRFKDLIWDWSEEEIDIADVSLEKVQFEFKGKSFNSSFQEFLTFIWGPHPIKEFEGVWRPLFVSGLDSI